MSDKRSETYLDELDEYLLGLFIIYCQRYKRFLESKDEIYQMQTEETIHNWVW